MSSLPQSMARPARILLVLLWAGLLALPFTGFVNAIKLVVVFGACVIFWKLVRTDRAAIIGKAAAEKFGRLRVLASSLLLHAKSPRTIALMLFLFIIIPIFLNDYYQDILTLIGMYTVLALGLNIVVGQAGLLNLGYAAFYAIGAYTYAIFSTTHGLAFWPGLAVGAFSSAICAALLGAPILRLRGDYFAIVTLGLGEITRIVLNNWDGMTGGPNGISKINRPAIAGYMFHTTLDFYFLILFLVVVTVFGMRRLISSRIGRAWIAIREDEIAAEAMGINTYRLRLLAFVLGSAVAGMVGVFFAAKMAFVSPESFTFSESVMILCMVVLGGMGSIPGIILGAFLLIGLPEVFRDFQDYRMLAFGTAMVLMMIFRPQGILGTEKRAD